jgi:hypothetical protein
MAVAGAVVVGLVVPRLVVAVTAGGLLTLGAACAVRQLRDRLVAAAADPSDTEADPDFEPAEG